MFVNKATAATAKSKRKTCYQISIILIICLIVIANIVLEEKEDKSINIESISLNPLPKISNSSHAQSKESQLVFPELFENKGVRQISLLGERHSGTTWIFDHLTDCFGHTLYVARHLTRYKHWFQFDDGEAHNKTLAISIFRNPYYWTRAMVSIPHHSPMHIGLDWKTFVSTPWAMPRVGKDLNITNMNGRICQDRFYYNEVISCIKRPYPDHYFDTRTKPKYSGHQPYYELKHDGSGEPYDSIIDLRTAKIMNFFEMINYSFVDDYWPMRYEELLRYGTSGLLQRIENATGVRAKCKPYESHVKEKRGLESEFIDWMNEHLDWNVEALIGYNKVANASEISNSPWFV